MHTRLKVNAIGMFFFFFFFPLAVCSNLAVSCVLLNHLDSSLDMFSHGTLQYLSSLKKIHILPLKMLADTYE